jgi:hypothetical protein
LARTGVVSPCRAVGRVDGLDRTVVAGGAGCAVRLSACAGTASVAPGCAGDWGGRGDWTVLAKRAGKTGLCRRTSAGRVVRADRAVGRIHRLDGAEVAAGTGRAIALLGPANRSTIAPGSAVRGGNRLDGAELACRAGVAIGLLGTSCGATIAPSSAGDGGGGSNGTVLTGGTDLAVQARGGSGVGTERTSRAVGGSDRLDGAVVAGGADRALALLGGTLSDPIAASVAGGGEGRRQRAVLADGTREAVVDGDSVGVVVVGPGGTGDGSRGVGRTVVALGTDTRSEHQDVLVRVELHAVRQGSLELALGQVDARAVHREVHRDHCFFALRGHGGACRGEVVERTVGGCSGAGRAVRVGWTLHLSRGRGAVGASLAGNLCG